MSYKEEWTHAANMREESEENRIWQEEMHEVFFGKPNGCMRMSPDDYDWTQDAIDLDNATRG